MKISRFKILTLFSFFILSLGIIGCEKSSKQIKTPTESKVNLTTVLEHKDSYIGDNSSIANILSNLPANIYYESFELQTSSTPYDITIHYKNFEDIPIGFEDNSSILSSFENVIKNNAIILFSLIKNVDIINFSIDNETIITYSRTDLINAHKDDFGNNLEEITKDKSALENFIKTNKS